MNKKIIFVGLLIISVICVIITVGVAFALKNNKARLDYQIEVVKEINYMLFSENNKFGVINKNGEIVVQSKYDEIQIPNPSKPLFICKYDYNPEKSQYQIKVLNDKSEQILYQYVVVEAIELDSGISEIPYEKSVLKHADKGKYGLIDFQGNIVVKAKYDEINSFEYNEGLLLVKKDGKYGIMNINGAIVVNEKYDKIISDGYYQDEQQYRNSGFIVAIGSENNYKYGYIDKYGTLVIPYEYDGAKIFSEGLAAVCKDEKCGYINDSGEVIIPFAYLSAGNFSNGVAEVCRDYSYSPVFINKENKIKKIYI